MTKKVLMIIGAGVYQYPAIETAKAMGIRTVAIDYKPGLPGLKLADISAPISITDQKEALNFAKANRIDGVFSMASDSGMATAVYIAKKLGLTSIDPSVLRFTSLNKTQMLKKMSLAGIPVVVHYQCADLEGCLKAVKKLVFPIVLKPVDGWGSRGLSLVEAPGDLKRAFERARNFSKMGCVSVEEFLDGINVTAEAFFYRKQLVFAGFSEKHITDDYFIPVRHIMPLAVNKQMKEELVRMVRDTGRVLRIKNGPLDVDIKLTTHGPKLLEAAPRLGGNCVPLVAHLSYGIDLIKAAIQVSLGQVPGFHVKKRPCYAGVKILSSSKEGIVKGVLKPRRLPKDVGLQIDLEKGDRVYPFHMSSCRIGHVLAKSNNLMQLEERLKFVSSSVKLKIKQNRAR